MPDRPEPGVRGDRDAIVTGEEGKLLDTPDDTTPAGAEHPFDPTGPGETATEDDAA